MLKRKQTRKNHSSYRIVRATLREASAMQKEADKRQEEAAKQREEAAAKRREEIESMLKEIARRQKETDRQLSKLGNRFGEMVEYQVIPNLITKFAKLGFVFEKAYHDASIKDKKNNIFAQVDITLENGDKVMLVEVKSKPNTADIIEHIERMEKVKAHSVFHGDKRKFLGAVAGMVFNDNEKAFAMKTGFFVIEPSGETFAITPPDGQPKEW